MPLHLSADGRGVVLCDPFGGRGESGRRSRLAIPQSARLGQALGLLDGDGRQFQPRGRYGGPGGHEARGHRRRDLHGGGRRHPARVRAVHERAVAGSVPARRRRRPTGSGCKSPLAAGPGWCGTGGPWIKPEQSMQHLVASETTTGGPARFDAVLPRPQPRTPFFGKRTLTPELESGMEKFLSRRGGAGVSPPGSHAANCRRR